MRNFVIFTISMLIAGIITNILRLATGQRKSTSGDFLDLRQA